MASPGLSGVRSATGGSEMVVNRSVRKLVAVALAAAAVAAVTQTGSHPVGARAAGAVASNRGYPNAVPPILAVAGPSELGGA